MTFVIKHRGRGGFVTADYLCPDHGRFELLVQRNDNGDPPSLQTCACGMTCEWVISAPPVHTQFVVSASQGKSAPKPHRLSLDTRPLAEGQRYHDWRKDRKKLWEEKRKERVMELAK